VQGWGVGVVGDEVLELVAWREGAWVLGARVVVVWVQCVGVRTRGLGGDWGLKLEWMIGGMLGPEGD
jgi:hypothetical protein